MRFSPSFRRAHRQKSSRQSNRAFSSLDRSRIQAFLRITMRYCLGPPTGDCPLSKKNKRCGEGTMRRYFGTTLPGCGEASLYRCRWWLQGSSVRIWGNRGSAVCLARQVPWREWQRRSCERTEDFQPSRLPRSPHDDIRDSGLMLDVANKHAVHQNEAFLNGCHHGDHRKRIVASTEGKAAVCVGLICSPAAIPIANRNVAYFPRTRMQAWEPSR